jgi:hypothetical protein
VEQKAAYCDIRTKRSALKQRSDQKTQSKSASSLAWPDDLRGSSSAPVSDRLETERCVIVGGAAAMDAPRDNPADEHRDAPAVEQNPTIAVCVEPAIASPPEGSGPITESFGKDDPQLGQSYGLVQNCDACIPDATDIVIIRRRSGEHDQGQRRINTPQFVREVRARQPRESQITHHEVVVGSREERECLIGTPHSAHVVSEGGERVAHQRTDLGLIIHNQDARPSPLERHHWGPRSNGGARRRDGT